MKNLITVLALTLSISAYANDDHKGLMCSNVPQAKLEKEMKSHQEKMLKKLNLTKEQKAQVETIHNSTKDKIFAQVQKLRGAHTELMGAIEKDASKDVLRERFNALGKEKQALMAEKTEVLLSIREILTPEQRQKAIAEIKDKKDDMCD